MAAIMNHTPYFPPKVLKQLNACRIFLQVLTLADISDGSGREVLKGSLQGSRHNDRRSSYDWPKQLRPSAGAWRTWRSTLQALFCVTPKFTLLRQPLKPWQHGGPKHQQWSYNVDPSTKCLVHCAELAGIFQCFHPAHSPWLFHFTPSILFARPSKLIPATVARSTQQFLELTARPMLAQEYEQYTSHPTSPLVATSIMQHIQNLPIVLHNTLGHCCFPLDTSALVAEFNQETLILASDGSVLQNDATQAWVLYGTSTESQAYRHGPVPGAGQLLTSLHAEIGGFVSGMLALDAILSTTPIPVTGTGRTLCALIDNKALISYIQKWHHQGQAGTLAPEYDLLQVAQGVIEKYKITVNPEHVKSHQDNTQAYKDLPW